jgi:predicted nuclease of predicted toxin-antitoxin system
VKVLLDENFPLQLYRHLLVAGHDVEHIIVAGQRGLPDSAIRTRLQTETALVFLTHDTEFEDAAVTVGSAVIISKVPQRIPVADRVSRWAGARVELLRPAGAQLG